MVFLQGRSYDVSRVLGSPGAYGLTCAIESVTPVLRNNSVKIF